MGEPADMQPHQPPLFVESPHENASTWEGMGTEVHQHGVFSARASRGPTRVRLIVNGRYDSGWNFQFPVGTAEWDMYANEYLAKISVIAEGVVHPICEVPFNPHSGYYQWVPVPDSTPYESAGADEPTGTSESDRKPGRSGVEPKPNRSRKERERSQMARFLPWIRRYHGRHRLR